ncbi:MAG: hypothetical protein KBC81_03395 [Candidatus Pacebacteria bacterium]|nr:hypothetical protein [Candidatus Paceibacterota bacterium]
MVNSEKPSLPGNSPEDEKKPTRQQRDISDFKEFVRLNLDTVKYSFKAEDDIYWKFYSHSGDSQIDPNSDEAVSIKSDYARDLKVAADTLGPSSSGKVNIKEDHYWFHVITNKGFDSREIGGRIYFNVDISAAPTFMGNLALALAAKGVNCHIKLPQSSKAIECVSRADKIVLYFNQSQEAEVLAVVENEHSLYSDKFTDVTPRFTSVLKDSNGALMEGVAFGEERSGWSFGELRSRALVGVLFSAKSKGLTIFDSSFNFEEELRESFEHLGIDPQNPSFNKSETDEFKLIKQRIAD